MAYNSALGLYKQRHHSYIWCHSWTNWCFLWATSVDCPHAGSL